MEYEKDFDGWNKKKKKLDALNQDCIFFEKQIWWSKIGINVGSEQNGKGEDFTRPVYILTKINSKTFIGIPLTSILREDDVHISFYFNYDFSTALISQIKLYDKKRLVKFIGITSDYIHLKIKKATIALILS